MHGRTINRQVTRLPLATARPAGTHTSETAPQGWVTCKRLRTFTKATLVCLATLLLISSDVAAQIFDPPTEINIEIDYMVLRDDLDNIIYTHKPELIEIQAVVQMFACRGITCNIIVDDELPYIAVMERDPENVNNFFAYYGPNSFGLLKMVYRNYGECWHYCIFGHRYQNTDYETSGSSGLAEMGGDEFIVTLGGWADSVGTPFERAATLAHELGHNLTLSHVGNMVEDFTGPYTPNLPSTMSYFCQLAGVRSKYIDRGLAQEAANLLNEIDYSDGIICTIVEPALDERFGIGMKKLDWDCDGVIETGTVAQDLGRDSLDHWCASSGLMSLLTDYNEWDSIRDYTCLKSRQELDDVPIISCITYEEHQQFMAKSSDLRQPPVEVEPCVNNRMRFVVPGFSPFGSGICDDPYDGLVHAHLLADPGDILFLKCGTYNEPVESLLLNKRMIITATSNAVIRPVGKGGGSSIANTSVGRVRLRTRLCWLQV